MADPGKGFIMKTTNPSPNGTVADQTVNPARDENKRESVESMAAEIHIQAHSVGPVLEEILKAGLSKVKTGKPTIF